jgi:RNA polymerase primary sigma factor
MNFYSISNNKFLPYIKEREYLKKIKNGDEKARDEFILLKLNVIIRVASKFLDRGVDKEDLFAEGVLGLLEAIDKYDLRRKVPFYFYAVHWIKHYMLKAIYSDRIPLKIPVHKQSDKIGVIKKRIELTKLFDRAVTTEEIAEASNLSVKEVEYLLDLDIDAISLDKELIHNNSDFGNATYNDVIGDKKSEFEDDILQTVYNNEVLECVNKLNKRQKTIIMLRYGFKNGIFYTLEQVGNILNLSRERIRQLEEKALKKLRICIEERRNECKK